MQSQHLAYLAYSLKENIGQDACFYMFQDGRANFDLFDFLLTCIVSGGFQYIIGIQHLWVSLTSGREA